VVVLMSLLVHLAVTSLVLHAPAARTHRAMSTAHAHRAASPHLVDWPWVRPAGNSRSSEVGKFEQHSELSPGCAPLGVLTAGLGGDDLEQLAITVENTFLGPEGQSLSYVPIAVLAKGDLRLRLRDILARLPERDSVLPDRPCIPKVPLVMFSGFNTVQTSAAVRALRALELRGGLGGEQRPMFAVAVPNALDKTLETLIDELEGDHLENAQPSQ